MDRSPAGIIKTGTIQAGIIKPARSSPREYVDASPTAN